MRYKKNGPPQMAVMIPTGNSEGGMTTRPTVSHSTRKIPPIRAEAGTRIRWSGEMSKRVKWGINKPTKAIRPLIETAAAVTNALETRIIF